MRIINLKYFKLNLFALYSNETMKHSYNTEAYEKEIFLIDIIK
uniref:Uncharacterized protein n=1 Tax=Bartonella schoenbuchensis (strain DSM 13525 / NCTC 13165 / R1) TaxID=687861 RepID=E6Z0H4_BARSR|nr:hypothetical protein B11C_40467 [Bartonella schoenbuchensis R1]